MEKAVSSFLKFLPALDIMFCNNSGRKSRSRRCPVLNSYDIFKIQDKLPAQKGFSMKVTGIIAEYNPFHSGHEYHIKEAKACTGADYVVIAMSGDFVQRGGPAVFDKYTRTHMALLGGADLVVELPSAFACSTAEDFAACGVALLTSLGAVDSVCFGSEEGNVHALMTAASLMETESQQYSALLQAELKTGATFPAARQEALSKIYGKTEDKPFQVLLSSPNNILGLEYCKAILRQNSPLQPVTILRKGAGYHDQLDSASPNGNAFCSSLPQTYASASGIRNALYREFPDGLHGKDDQSFNGLDFLPESVRPLFSQANPLWPEDFSALLNAKILAASDPGCENALTFSKISDFSPDLALRLNRLSLDFTGWEGRIAQLKTRQYTYTRISRALTKLLLGITSQQIQDWKSMGYAPYARILGFRRTAAPLLSELKKSSRIPLITKPVAAFHTLSEPALQEFQKDLYASHLYQCALEQRCHRGSANPGTGINTVMKNELNRKLLVLE